MKRFLKQLTTFILVVFFLFVFLFPFVSEAATRVRGYFRKDGTYVQPHYRSDPNGNPYDNWSFPGNTNPYTRETAKGNPDTYLKNYYSDKVSPSPSPSPSSLPYFNSSFLTPPTSSDAAAKNTQSRELKAAAQRPLLLRDIETSRADYIENPHWFREKLIDKLGLRYSYLDRDFIAGNVYSLLEDIK